MSNEQIHRQREYRQAYFKSELTTRSEQESEKYIEGYFAVFNQETELWTNYFEKIANGAFDISLKNNDIRCLFNHNSDFVLGRTLSKTLELKVDDKGLWGRVKINENDSQALDVYARVQRGDISGCSFGFYPISEEYEEKEDSIHWTVTEADTSEVSIVTFPAYPQTEIQARKKEHEKNMQRELKIKKQRLRKKLEGLYNVKTT